MIPPFAAVAMPPAVPDRLHSIDTTLINADEIGLGYGRQSRRRLPQKQASGNSRCCNKGQRSMRRYAYGGWRGGHDGWRGDFRHDKRFRHDDFDHRHHRRFRRFVGYGFPYYDYDRSL
jgi:hypothetical protein